MLQSKGIRVVEPYSLHGMTATRVPRAGRPVRPAHRRPPRRRRRGHVRQRDRHRQDPRPAVHRLGRHRGAGPGHLRPDARHGRDAQPPGQALGRSRRRQGLHPQPHGRVRREVRRQRHHQDRVGNPDGQHGRALRRRRDRRGLGLPTRRSSVAGPAHALPHAHRDDARQGPHERRADQPRGNPVQLGTGEIDYAPIFAAAKNSNVKWYHYELDPPNSATFDAFADRAQLVRRRPRRRRSGPVRLVADVRRRAGRPDGLRRRRCRSRSRTSATRR